MFCADRARNGLFTVLRQVRVEDFSHGLGELGEKRKVRLGRGDSGE